MPTEWDFQQEVIQAAHDHHWRIFHPSPCKTSRGRWVTASAGAKGFPDLVLAHPDRGVIFAELKKQDGTVTAEQTEWLLTLTAGGAEAVIWRPSDWPTILDRLTQDRT